MKVALVNPSWDFTGSIYFGCREPHLPLELAYCEQMLRAAGHDAAMFDGQLFGLDHARLVELIVAFAADMTVITTAPSYLFWRCPPPELRVPADLIARLGIHGGLTVLSGPHGSVTPGPALRKTGAAIAVRGECEEVVAALAEAEDARAVPGVAWLDGDEVKICGAPNASPFTGHAPLDWPVAWLRRHRHHHHRFDARPDGPGAEVEASRGCPFACTFCAKLDYRDRYRRRELDIVLEEIDRLIAKGVTYVYFIDEIFLPQEDLLEALIERPVAFGIQTRIDLWKLHQLDLLGRAGCVSVEAGVESLSVEARAALAKRCRLDNDDLASLLIECRRHVPFVQANLIGTEADDPQVIARWRERLQRAEVWSNDPVPLYPYPSSPEYRRLWGMPDDHAWERAHEHYLASFARFSDIQDQAPLGLPELEAACRH